MLQTIDRLLLRVNLYYNNPKHHKLDINHYQTSRLFNINLIFQQSDEAIEQ